MIKPGDEVLVGHYWYTVKYVADGHIVVQLAGGSGTTMMVYNHEIKSAVHRESIFTVNKEMLVTQDKSYYAVVKSVVTTPFTKRHLTYSEAEREARRLAALNPGVEYHILHCDVGVRTVEPKTEVFSLRG